LAVAQVRKKWRRGSREREGVRDKSRGVACLFVKTQAKGNRFRPQLEKKRGDTCHREPRDLKENRPARENSGTKRGGKQSLKKSSLASEKRSRRHKREVAGGVRRATTRMMCVLFQLKKSPRAKGRKIRKGASTNSRRTRRGGVLFKQRGGKGCGQKGWQHNLE